MKEMVGGCCVCSDERGWAENPLVYCDGHGCNVAVHQACYGIVQVPTGPWFCRKCESQERAARVRCELCPQKDGALKRTDTQGWAHVVCALYIPEVRFGNVTTMEPIVLQYVPQERYNKTCYICEEHGRENRANSGAFMQCNKSGCKQTFHVTCAQSQGLLCEEAGNFMDNVKYCGYCAYHYKKLKKDSHIKTIPAFKPIPADNATPDSTPEKTPVKPEKSKVKEMKTQKSTVIEYGSSISSVSGATANTSNTSSSLSGKFTTANFTETTITSSGPGLLTNNSAKLKWPSQHPTTTSPSFSPASSASVTSPSGTALSEVDAKPVSNVKGGNFSIIASIPLSDSKGEQLQVSSNKSSPLNHTSQNTSPTSRPESGAVTTSHSSNTASVSGTPTTATNSNSLSQPQTTSTFSYSFENFLRGNYPNPSTSQTTMPSSSPPSTTTAVTETCNSQQPAKRPRAKSLEKGEKKKPKKAKQGTNGTTKAKTVKDLLASANSLSPPPSPVPVVPPVTSSAPTPSPVPALNLAAKKSGQKKRKDSSSSLASSISSQSFSVSTSSISTPFSQSLTAASPVTMATIHKTGESLVNSLPSTTVSGASSQSGVATMGLLSTALSSSTVTSQDQGDSESLVNGTSPLLGPQRPNSTGVVTSPRTAAERSQSFPTSMEQLLERQWEQGSTFLMEQGQHFDIASLLSCLHQLRAENQRLEEHIQVLTARRDQLLAVNARLSMPLTPINNPHSTSHNNTSSHGTSPESVGGHNRSPRINNYIPPENCISQDMNSTFNRSTSRSPAQSHSPAHNSYAGGQGSSQGHSPAGPQPVVSHNSRSPGPEVRPGPAPSLSSSPAHLVMSESQRQVLLQQQQQMFVNHQISSEQQQQQQLMLHMMQQQQQQQQQHQHQHQQQSTLFPAATPTSMGSAPPARPSPMLPSQSTSTPSKSGGAKQKEKT